MSRDFGYLPYQIPPTHILHRRTCDASILLSQTEGDEWLASLNIFKESQVSITLIKQHDIYFILTRNCKRKSYPVTPCFDNLVCGIAFPGNQLAKIRLVMQNIEYKSISLYCKLVLLCNRYTVL